MRFPFFKKKKSKLKSETQKLIALLERHKIGTILDVGANAGQYTQEILNHGYKGDIISFEPLQAMHESLHEKSGAYKNWTIAPVMAIGAQSGKIEINVSERPDMSSIRDINPETLMALPGSDYTHKEEVEIKALDDVADEYIQPGKNIFLKVDTQGFEMDVLRGAEKSLDRLTGIQLELSLLPLYEGEPLFHEIVAWLSERGFESHLVIPGFFSKKLMRQMQIDIVFFKGAEQAG